MRSKELVLLVFIIFLIFNRFSVHVLTNTIDSEQVDTLNLTPYSLSWELFQQDDEKVTFLFFANITITNNFSTNITIIFFDGCIWLTEVKCTLKNDSLETKSGGEICTLESVPITFPPGQTNMTEHAKLYIYDSSISELPQGHYEIIIGESYSEFYEEIAAPARIYLEILEDSFNITYNKNPFTVTTITFQVFSAAFFMVVLVFSLKKRRAI